MSGPVKFARLTKAEGAAVDRIVDRAHVISIEAGVGFDAISLRMDLSAAHAETPLRLEELAEADDFNFTHDVFGIIRHMDRTTGKLGGCFVPRFARREVPA